MSFFEVKLVQEGLPIKQVVKWLRSNFKESWPASEEAACEPEGDPACDGRMGDTEHCFFLLPLAGLSQVRHRDYISSLIGQWFFIKLAVIFIPSSQAGQHLGSACGSILFSLGDQVGENVAMPQSLGNWLEGDREKHLEGNGNLYLTEFPRYQYMYLFSTSHF